MARASPDFWLADATGSPSWASTHYLSFSVEPVYAGWRGSAAVYISTGDVDSATLYNVSATAKASYTNWTYPTGLTSKQAAMMRVARSNVASAQNFSGTVFLGPLGSAGGDDPNAGFWGNQTVWVGVSVPDNAPSGWYFGKLLVKGVYSMPTGAQTLSYNQPFKFEVRPRDWQSGDDPGGRTGAQNWVVKTKHVAFRGNKPATTYRPYRHANDQDLGDENPPRVPAQVISTTRDHMVAQTRGGSKPTERYDEPFMWVRGDDGTG